MSVNGFGETERRERQKLDQLVGLALLDKSLCEDLLNGGSYSLSNGLKLAAQTVALVRVIEASSLEEFAQAILDKLDGVNVYDSE